MEWCSFINDQMKCIDFATYTIKTDCHDADYTVKTMKRHFYATPHLAPLISNYYTDPEISIDQILNCPNDVTFIAVLDGYAEKNADLKPLFLQNEKRKWDRHSDTPQSMLLTKDYCNFLIKNFNFQITSVQSIFFYKVCPLFNTIYQNLVHQRTDPYITANKKQLLKNIVNYSAGFFGFNQNKKMTQSHRIVSEVTTCFDMTKHSIQYLGDVQDTCYLIKTTCRYFDSETTKQKACVSPLALYVTIVEFGKLRMAEILTFFDYYLLPENYRHLYSNIDNVIIALSTPTLESSVKPHLVQQFDIEKHKFLHPTLPGHLKVEFQFFQENEWKFISPMMQNHAIITKESTAGTHKNSSIRYASTQQAYNYSLKLLQRHQISVPQTRRVNKLLNTNVHKQTFVLNLK